MPWLSESNWLTPSGLQYPLIVVLALWSIVWTGFALWHSAKRNEKWWFVFFLFIHTAGIVELLYLGLVAGIFRPKKIKAPHKHG